MRHVGQGQEPKKGFIRRHAEARAAKMGDRMFGLLDVATSGLQQVVESPEFDRLMGAGTGLADRAMDGGDADHARTQASIASLRAQPAPPPAASPEEASAVGDRKRSLTERTAARHMGVATGILRFGMGKMSDVLESDAAGRAMDTVVATGNQLMDDPDAYGIIAH